MPSRRLSSLPQAGPSPQHCHHLVPYLSPPPVPQPAPHLSPRTRKRISHHLLASQHQPPKRFGEEVLPSAASRQFTRLSFPRTSHSHLRMLNRWPGRTHTVRYSRRTSIPYSILAILPILSAASESLPHLVHMPNPIHSQRRCSMREC